MPVDLGESSCLTIPTVPPKQILYAVWLDDNNNSCTCPLCHSGNNNDCTLTDCQCYSESSFKPVLRIGQNVSNSRLCWPKISADKNNSNVHFYTEGIVTECDGKRLSSSFVSTSLVSATTFLVRGKQVALFSMNLIPEFCRSSTTPKYSNHYHRCTEDMFQYILILSCHVRI